MPLREAAPSSVADYTILPLRLSRTPSCTTSAIHYLYLRPHEPKIPHLDSPRSLFLVNVPLDSTLLHFRSLFADQLDGGRVERIDFEDVSLTNSHEPFPRPRPNASKSRKRKRTDYNTQGPPGIPETWDCDLHSSGTNAVAVFADRPSMELASRAAKRAAKRGGEAITWGLGLEEQSPSLGSTRYFTHHSLSFPSKDELQSTVDTYMTTFAATEAAHTRTLARQRSVPDADGFVTVTRGGRAGPARLQEAQDKMEELKKKEEAKRAEMSDFYRFQVRETKKRQAGELVKRFEEDRRKVEEMRRQRGNRFKPA